MTHSPRLMLAVASGLLALSACGPTDAQPNDAASAAAAAAANAAADHNSARAFSEGNVVPDQDMDGTLMGNEMLNGGIMKGTGR